MDPGSKLKAALINRDYCLAKQQAAYDELRRAVDTMVAAQDRCDIATDAYGSSDLAHQQAERQLKAALAETGLTLTDVLAQGHDMISDALLTSAA